MKLFGVIVLIIIGIFIGYSFSPQITGLSGGPDTEGGEESTPQVTEAELSETSDSYAINITYPQFGVAAIDSQIKAAVDAAVDEIKSIPANPAGSATPQNSLDGSFNSVYIGPDAISVTLVLSQYTGGAHPMTILSGLNFDRTTGKRLGLEDALALTGLTVGEVSAQATAELQTKLGESFFPEGTTTNPENFSSFKISADKVTFIFQQYQAGPYAAGPQEVSFERKN